MPRNPHHEGSVAQSAAPRPKKGRPVGSGVGNGKAVRPLTEVVEGATESIFAFRTTVEAIVEWVQIQRIAAEQVIAHRQRLERVTLPAIERGYQAAEKLISIERAREQRGLRVVAASRVQRVSFVSRAA